MYVIHKSRYELLCKCNQKHSPFHQLYYTFRRLGQIMLSHLRMHVRFSSFHAHKSMLNKLYYDKTIFAPPLIHFLNEGLKLFWAWHDHMFCCNNLVYTVNYCDNYMNWYLWDSHPLWYFPDYSACICSIYWDATVFQTKDAISA